MPIIFISLNSTFNEIVKQCGYEAHTMKIQDYIPNKKTYYVSPANSLCFMDGGIDYALSRIVFPNIEKTVKNTLKSLNINTLLGRPYLPIGSSIIIDADQTKSLIVSPTMLLPQNISNTNNVYYATMSILYNILINRCEKLENIDIIFTAFGCGYGKMTEETSINQILNGIKDYVEYKPKIINQSIIIAEPNLDEQPKYYQNSEFFTIKPNEIIRTA